MSDQTFPDRVRRILAARSPLENGDRTLSPASVLLPLFASSAGAAPQIWLVRRAEFMRVHGGQVALPGGKQDAGDADLLATALREADEEIGLSASKVDVLGRLDDCVTVTGFVVTPFVGWITDSFAPRPMASEVARVFAVPLAAFALPPQELRIPWAGSERVVLCYQVGGETIWGATARILATFSGLLGGPAVPPGE